LGKDPRRKECMKIWDKSQRNKDEKNLLTKIAKESELSPKFRLIPILVISPEMNTLSSEMDIQRVGKTDHMEDILRGSESTQLCTWMLFVPHSISILRNNQALAGSSLVTNYTEYPLPCKQLHVLESSLTFCEFSHLRNT
jgi:hypothetical protein